MNILIFFINFIFFKEAWWPSNFRCFDRDDTEIDVDEAFGTDGIGVKEGGYCMEVCNEEWVHQIWQDDRFRF